MNASQSGPENAPSLPLPNLTELGFNPAWLDETVEIVPQVVYSREEILSWQLEFLHKVASDPGRRSETVGKLRDFSDRERSHTPRPIIADHDMAAEVADFARSAVANYTDLPALRRVLLRGSREGTHQVLTDDDDTVASEFSREDEEGLANAVHGAVKLAQALFAQEHGTSLDILSPLELAESPAQETPTDQRLEARPWEGGVRRFMQLKKGSQDPSTQ